MNAWQSGKPQDETVQDPHPEDATDETQEERQSLWLLAASPLIWATHFLATYLTVAIWCAKIATSGESLGAARIAVAVYTAVALAGIFFFGWIGGVRHSYGTGTLPHDFDTPADRHRFLGFATLLLSGLSAVATIFVSLAAYFVEGCD